MNIKAVTGPKQTNPFNGRPALEEEFWVELLQRQQNLELPGGYGLVEGENNFQEYESVEMLPIKGKSSGKVMQMILPKVRWFPRTVLWLQALEIMYNLAYD